MTGNHRTRSESRSTLPDRSGRQRTRPESDPLFNAELKKAWRELQQPKGTTDAQRRVKSLAGDVTQARERIRRATDLFVDEKIDKAAYDDKCERERATIESAEAEISRLREQVEVPALPPLELVLRRVTSWADAVKRMDLGSQRDILTMLVEYVKPVRTGHLQYDPKIEWTPDGKALRTVAAALSAAA